MLSVGGAEWAEAAAERDAQLMFVSLIVTSGIGARTGHTNLSRTLVRTLTVGLGTMGVSYLVGKLVF
jgi:VIT1/CCC1 family predicted Fe2+/Mn2+ transporter